MLNIYVWTFELDKICELRNDDDKANWAHYTCVYYIYICVYSYTLGCNNGGGDGTFSKVKRLVAKWIWTRKRLFSSFLTAQDCDLRNARNATTFSQGIFYSKTRVCILASIHKLLEYHDATTVGFGPALLRWRPNMWGFPATFAFCIKAHGLATFFIAPKNSIFGGASFEPLKNLATSCA